MKKVTLMLVVLALLTLTAIGVSAAGSETVPDIEPTTDGKYSVTYTGTEGEMYGFVVIEGAATSASPSTGTIVYIDQQTAGTGGALSFADFGLLGLDPTTGGYNTICTVFIGGGSLETATAIAELVPTPASEEPGGGDDDDDEGEGVTVSGTITDTVGSRKNATVQLIADGGSVAGEATTNEGAYSIENVATGNYSLVVTKESFLKYTLTGVPVTDSALVIPAIDISAYAGDLDANNKVEIADLRYLLGDYNASGDAITVSASDIDSNGKVEINDLRALLGNYNDMAQTGAYQAAN